MSERDGLTDAETETLASKILTAKPLGELNAWVKINFFDDLFAGQVISNNYLP